MESTQKLRFVVFRDEGVWAAHGIEHNVVTVGETLAEVRRNIGLIVRAYQQQSRETGRDLIGELPPASWEVIQRYIIAVEAGRWLNDASEEPVKDEDPYATNLPLAS